MFGLKDSLKQKNAKDEPDKAYLGQQSCHFAVVATLSGTMEVCKPRYRGVKHYIKISAVGTAG